MKSNYLQHHGILGQRWGVRRYQNEDGSLTPAGRKRYDILDKAAKKAEDFKKIAQEDKNRFSKSNKNSRDARIADKQIKRYEEIGRKYKDLQKNVSSVDKKTMKEAEQFVKNAFFTNADYAYYYSNGKWHNTEDY